MDNNLVNSENNLIFANEFDEPCGALAMDVDKDIPILRGEDAERFLENMEKAEREYEKRKNIPPTLEELEKEYGYKKIILDMERNSLLEMEKELKKLEEKIKDLKKS